MNPRHHTFLHTRKCDERVTLMIGNVEKRELCFAEGWVWFEMFLDVCVHPHGLMSLDVKTYRALINRISRLGVDEDDVEAIETIDCKQAVECVIFRTPKYHTLMCVDKTRQLVCKLGGAILNILVVTVRKWSL